MVTSIRNFKVNFRRGWKATADECKVMDFLNARKGKRIVSDFYATLKRFNGSRFTEAFADAVERLAYQTGAYLLVDFPLLAEAYQSLENDILDCLKNRISEREAIQTVAICIFWILHIQNVDV